MTIDYATNLKALQLYGMATAWGELQAEKPRQVHRPEVWMERLIAAEQTDRQLKSLRYQIKAARFPIHRDLTGIDWAETPLSQAVVEQLASAAFMETAHNLILVGGTGTGKSHLATAIGVAAVHHGKRIRFFNAVDLVNQLEREKNLGRVGYPRITSKFCCVRLLRKIGEYVEGRQDVMLSLASRSTYKGSFVAEGLPHRRRPTDAVTPGEQLVAGRAGANSWHVTRKLCGTFPPNGRHFPARLSDGLARECRADLT